MASVGAVEKTPACEKFRVIFPVYAENLTLHLKLPRYNAEVLQGTPRVYLEK